MKNPKISVIMGIYNCAATLPAAIDSILAQTYTNWELIMCDDGSRDNTYEVAKSYQEKYPNKITLIKNDVNMKLPRTLNHCLQYATGKYTARMDGDDRSYPERFQRQVEFLDKHPDIDVVGTGMTNFYDSEINGYRPANPNPSPACIGMGVPFNHATIMMKTSVYKALHGYSEKPYVIRCEDVDLWMRFFAAGYKGANIDEPLYYVREDMDAVKRRHVRDGFRVAKMLFINFRKFHYPHRQYVYLFKPVISCLVPQSIKYYFNKYRWR